MTNAFDYVIEDTSPGICWMIGLGVLLLGVVLLISCRLARKKHDDVSVIGFVATGCGTLLALGCSVWSLFAFTPSMINYDTGTIAESIQHSYKVEKVLFDSPDNLGNLDNPATISLVSSADHTSHDCVITNSAVVHKSFDWSRLSWRNTIHSEFRCFTDDATTSIQKR